jgi:hypothetical protein
MVLHMESFPRFLIFNQSEILVVIFDSGKVTENNFGRCIPEVSHPSLVHFGHVIAEKKVKLQNECQVM